MGISCGDNVGSSYTDNWKMLSPFLKWKEACKSIGRAYGDPNDPPTTNFDQLCCDVDFDDSCTTGCKSYTRPYDLFPTTYCTDW